MLRSLWPCLLAVAWAHDLALSSDDECSVSATCALNALQVQSDGQFLVEMINKVLAKKLPEINTKVSEGMKSKDPVHVEVKKGPLVMDEISGLSGMHIDAFQATGFKLPSMALAMSGKWTGELKVHAVVEVMGKKVPCDAQLHGVSFKSQEIDMVLQRKPVEIKSFDVKDVEVMIESISVQVHLKMPFLAKMADKLANSKINEAKGKIAEKVAEKMKEIMAKTLNDKVKASLNGMISKMMPR